MKFLEFLQSEKSKHPHYLLFGNPISHSVSPLMHNTALKHYSLDAKYHAVALSMREIPSVAAHLNAGNFLGANVTIPHKETMMQVVDELTGTARDIGAINTILKADGKLIGHNTDAYGFKYPILEYQDDLEAGRAIIFGVGGATKAIIYALNDLGFAEVCLVSRRPERHKELGPNVIACSYDDWQHYAEDASLLVNATPLGMVPNTEASPVADRDIELLADKICYDIVYNPRETKFLKQAKSVGAKPIGGIEMLIHQGAESFRLWTGKPFPVSLVKMKLDEG